MANDCLVTKLRGSIDNDNLLPVGVLKIKKFSYLGEIDNEQLRNTLYIKYNNGTLPTGIRVDGNGSFTINGTTYTKQNGVVTIPRSQTGVIFSNGDYNIYIYGKYEIDKIICPSSIFSNYMYFDFFDTTNVKYMPNLIQFLVGFCKFLGDIKELGKMTKLITLRLMGTGVVGSIEDFVEEQINNSRTNVEITNAIELRCRYTNIYFGSTLITYDGYLTYASKNKIIIYSNSTVESSTVIHERGCSAEEIAAWQAAGKTVTDVASGTVYPPTN